MKLIYTILLLISLRIQATTYYFSTSSGNDSRTFTQAQSVATPWQTIAKLNTIIGSLTPGDQILFKKGDVFDGALSTPANGNSAARIIFGSYGTGSQPVLNGFQSLTTWTNLGGNIWEASVNSGTTLNLVVLNGTPIPQGRTPNAGSYYTVVASGGISYPVLTGYLKGQSSQINASIINWTGAELVVRSTQYTKDRNLVTSCSDSTINYNSQSAHNADIGGGFFFQNDVRTVDVQNEWYYNSAAHTIRMYSSANPSTIGTGIKAAVYDMCVSADPVSCIEFNDLKFQGYDSTALRFRNSMKMKVTGCSFDMIGCNGIYFESGVRDTISNNTITNIQNTGIGLAIPTYPVVISNTINGCGLIEGTAQGNNQQMDGILLVQTVDSAVIMDNVVKNTGYCGITFDGRNTIVRKNRVDSFGLSLADGGGIYSCCNFVGNEPAIGRRKVDSNIVTNGFGQGSYGMPGIYLDDNVGQLDVINNTVVNTTRAGIFLHNTVDIKVINNTVYETTTATGIEMTDDDLGNALRSTVVTGNIINVSATQSCIQLQSDLNDYGSMGIFYNNNYSRSLAGTFFKTRGNVSADYSLSTWQSGFSWDGNSSFTLVNDDSVRIDYNYSPADKYIFLSDTYSDFKAGGYYRYVSVPAYGSLLLFRKTFGTIKTARPVKIVQ